MVKTMTTSTMTEGQVGRALGILGDKLRKHMKEFPSDIVQQVFGQAELGEEWLASFRRRVETLSSLIVRVVTVNGDRTPQQVIDATGRAQYVDKDVVNAMPRTASGEREVVFFKPRPEAYENGWLSPEALAKEYEYFGLTPDPHAVAAVNEADPAFADQTPNAVQWPGANRKFYYAAFGRFSGERRVDVRRCDGDWLGGWVFGGVRKYQK